MAWDSKQPGATSQQDNQYSPVTNDVHAIVKITQAAYDALGAPDENTLYVIVPG